MPAAQPPELPASWLAFGVVCVLTASCWLLVYAAVSAPRGEKKTATVQLIAQRPLSQLGACPRVLLTTAKNTTGPGSAA